MAFLHLFKNADDFSPNEVHEECWFKPEDHEARLRAYCEHFQGAQVVHCVDAFGASRSVFKAFERAGCNARAYDVKLSPDTMDILTEAGVMTFLSFGLSMFSWAIMVAGLPCQWFIFMSSSVHRRHTMGPLGNLAHPRVRLANRIVDTFVFCVRLLQNYRSFWVLCEQPKSSTMFGLPSMEQLLVECGMEKVLTYMGLFETW